jgi:hypothetical protein
VRLMASLWVTLLASMTAQLKARERARPLVPLLVTLWVH